MCLNSTTWYSRKGGQTDPAWLKEPHAPSKKFAMQSKASMQGYFVQRGTHGELGRLFICTRGRRTFRRGARRFRAFRFTRILAITMTIVLLFRSWSCAGGKGPVLDMRSTDIEKVEGGHTHRDQNMWRKFITYKARLGSMSLTQYVFID